MNDSTPPPVPASYEPASPPPPAPPHPNGTGSGTGVEGIEALLADQPLLTATPKQTAAAAPTVRSGPGHAEALLQAAIRMRASDLHAATGLKPAARISGTIQDIDGFEPLTAQDVLRIAEVIDPNAPAKLAHGDVDFGGHVPGAGDWRARGNLHNARQQPALVIRFLTGEVPHMAGLGVPPMVGSLADLTAGLVLLAGETGSGKTTTHAALIDQINSKYTKTILTLEDPVEYLHKSKRSRVTQRELYTDFQTFERGLQSAMRSDPDVILLGEIRSPESAEVAMNAAASGHLVLSTVHGRNVPQALARLVDLFPAEDHDHVRSLLAGSIEAVVCQVLLRRQDDMSARQVVCEALRVDPGARGVIRAGRFEDLPNIIQSSQLSTSFEQQFAEHVAGGRLTIEQAMGNVTSQDLFRRYLQAQPKPVRATS